VKVAEGLEPLADPKIWKNRLAEITEDTTIVGHLPHLSKLAGYLLTGDEGKEVVTFRMGGIACLERDESGRWTVQWMINPEIIP
jgi:phosphohistidine phosphatase